MATKISTHPLEGVWIKIRRAEQLIKQLKLINKAYIETKPYIFTHKEDPQLHQTYILVKDIKPIPDECVAIIGDAIHNLRSTLDLLACQLIKQSDITDLCENTYFPIANNYLEFQKKIKEKKIQKFGFETLQIIKEIEPYKNGAGNSIWELHRLDIKDKHRILIVAVAAINRVELTVNENPDSQVMGRKGRIVSSLPNGEFTILTKGQEFMKLDTDSFAPQVGDRTRIDFQFRGEIVFNEPGIIERKPVIQSLEGYASVVRNLVEKFASFFLK